MILAPLFIAAVCHLDLSPRFPSVDTLDVARVATAPVIDGQVNEHEYGASTLEIPTAAGTVTVWVKRHDGFVYIAASLPDSTFYWGDDFVVNLDPTGRGGPTLIAGNRQWYLRRDLDSSVVAIAEAGRWYSPGIDPHRLGSIRHHADWDVAATSSPTRWMVELRIRAAVVRSGGDAPRLAFRTYNDRPAGWWSWPAAPTGLPPRQVERNPDLWIPLRLP